MAARPIAWQRRYRLKLITTDTSVVVFSVLVAQLLRFGISNEDLDVSVFKDSAFIVGYTLISAALAVGWLLSLSIFATRDPKVFGLGSEEYKRIITATFATFGTLAILAYLFRSQVGRGYVLLALPLGLVLLLLSRWLWRKRLHQQRRRHKNVYRTLIVGEHAKCAHAAEQISRNRYAGFGLLGAITDTPSGSDLLPGLPVLGDHSSLMSKIDELHIETVIMTSSDSIGPEFLRRISWELESRGVELIVAAALTDIAGPRIHTRPVSGLPLIHVEYPSFSGRKYFAKRTTDILASLLLIVVLSPLLVTLWALVRLDSNGPAIFRQERVGFGGTPFKMYKFRSMVTDAEQQLKSLLDSSDADGPLFKIKDDPRVTSIGRTLRKYSLDELPQLFNVLKGEMSLVGPRPPLPQEVEQYGRWETRRLLVKPGITGLWQVSGRSNLSWEDSIRLDLYYVENWSVTGDLVILWKTVRAVVSPEGAY